MGVASHTIHPPWIRPCVLNLIIVVATTGSTYRCCLYYIFICHHILVLQGSWVFKYEFFSLEFNYCIESIPAMIYKICDVSFRGSNINYVFIVYNDHFINWLLYPSVSLKKSTWNQLTQVHTSSLKFNNLMKSAYFH